MTVPVLRMQNSSSPGRDGGHQDAGRIRGLPARHIAPDGIERAYHLPRQDTRQDLDGPHLPLELGRVELADVLGRELELLDDRAVDLLVGLPDLLIRRTDVRGAYVALELAVVVHTDHIAPLANVQDGLPNVRQDRGDILHRSLHNIAPPLGR